MGLVDCTRTYPSGWSVREVLVGLAKRQTRHTGFPDCVSFELEDRHAVHVTFPQAEHRPPLVSAKRKPHAWHVHGTILVSGVIPYDSPLRHNDSVRPPDTR